MDKIQQALLNSEETIPNFGYYLIRETLIKDLLGKEHESMLYWAGKSLGRKFPLSTLEEMTDFFEKAGWGQLIVKKEGKDEMSFQLTSSFQELGAPLSYQLEAGFLAEQIQFQKKYVAEAIVTKKRENVVITVKWDRKDIITG